MNQYRVGADRDMSYRNDDWRNNKDFSFSSGPDRYSNKPRNGQDDTLYRRRDNFSGGYRRSPSPLMSRNTNFETPYDTRRDFSDDYANDRYDGNQGMNSLMNNSQRTVMYDNFGNNSSWNQRNRDNDRSNMGYNSVPQSRPDYNSPRNGDFNRGYGGQSNAQFNYKSNTQFDVKSRSRPDSFEPSSAKRPRLSDDSSYSRNVFSDGNNRTMNNPSNSFNNGNRMNRMDFDSSREYMGAGNRNMGNTGRTNMGNSGRTTMGNSGRTNMGNSGRTNMDFGPQMGNNFDNYNDNWNQRNVKTDFGSQGNNFDDFHNNRNDLGGRNRNSNFNDNRFNRNKMNTDFGSRRDARDIDVQGRGNFGMRNDIQNVSNVPQMTPVESLLKTISANLPLGLDASQNFGGGSPQLGNLAQNSSQIGELQLGTPNAIFNMIANTYKMQLANQAASLLQNIPINNYQDTPMAPNSNFNNSIVPTRGIPKRKYGISLNDVKNHTGPFGFLIVFYICQEHPLTTLSKTASLFKKDFKQSFTFDNNTKKWTGKILYDGKLVFEGSDENQYACKLNVATKAVKKLRKHYYTVLMTKTFGVNTVVDRFGNFVNRKGRLAGAKGDFMDTVDPSTIEKHRGCIWQKPVPNLNKLRDVILEYKDSITNINDLVFASEIPGKERLKLEKFAKAQGLAVERGGGKLNRFLIVTKKNDIMTIVYNLIEIETNPKGGKYRLLRPGQDFRVTGIPLDKIELQANPKKMVKGEKKQAGFEVTEYVEGEENMTNTDKVEEETKNGNEEVVMPPPKEDWDAEEAEAEAAVKVEEGATEVAETDSNIVEEATDKVVAEEEPKNNTT